MRLQRVIQLYLFVIVMILTLVNAYGISSLYHAGLDDSSQFYLWKDTELAKAYYQQYHQLPASNGFREFYPNIQAIPVRYTLPLTHQGWQFNQATLIQLTGESVYFMPFALPNNIQPAFVLHRFTDADDEGYTDSNLWTVTWHLSLLALPIILIAAYILFYVIAEPIKKLSQWAQQLSTETSPQRLSSKPLHFLELQLLAEQLYRAFRAVCDSNEREKQFLRTLSHELRTPLAVTSTTLDVLAKKDDGQLRHFQPQLDRIRRANNSMQQVTDSLLWLWREPSTPLARYPTNVKCLVEQIWQTLQLHALEPSALTLEMKPELTFHVDPALFQIVLANLLLNALNYGQLNTLVVSANAQQFSVRNAVDHSKHVQGSGVGLYLVEHIAQRLAWQLAIERQNTHFVVSITF